MLFNKDVSQGCTELGGSVGGDAETAEGAGFYLADAFAAAAEEFAAEFEGIAGAVSRVQPSLAPELRHLQQGEQDGVFLVSGEFAAGHGRLTIYH